MSQKKNKIKRLGELTLKKSPILEVLAEDKHSIIKILQENWRFMVLISIGIFILFLNAFRGDFVSDDYATILNNPQVSSWSSMAGNVTPVVFTNFMIAAVFGVAPIFYHAFSIFFYIVICWVLLVFLNFIISKNLARVAIFMFAFMPLHVEAVSWISGKPYLFLAFFITISFLGFVKYLEDNKWEYLLVSGLSFFLAVLTDPPRPFSLFFVIFLYLVIVNKKIYWQKVGKLVPIVLVVFLAAVFAKLPLMMQRIGIAVIIVVKVFSITHFSNILPVSQNIYS